MIVARTNEYSYLKSLYLLIWRFFGSFYVEEEVVPDVVWPCKPITPLVLHTDDEEDYARGNQVRRELASLDDYVVDEGVYFYM